MKAVQIVTIKSFTPIYKDGEEATNITICNVKEHSFDVVVQKGLYQIEDKAVFIQPDYCLSDIPLFTNFIAPQGDVKKSKLGKNNRIKAIKFNFVDNTGSKVYSNGILMPLSEILYYLYINNISYDDINTLDLDIILGITKYEEPEKLSRELKSGLKKAPHLPIGMYKTDEVNIKNVTNLIKYPIELIGTLKIDGSSCSIYYKSEEEYGICSRNQEKKLDQKQVIGYEGFKRYYAKELNKRGWLHLESNTFYDEIEIQSVEGLVPIEDVLYDDFIELGKPILDKLIVYCQEKGKQLVLRGEIAGKNLKGSGNKNNPHSKLDKAFYLFGIDDYSSGIAVSLSYNEYVSIFTEMNLTVCPIITHKVFNSFKEIKKECQEYFNENLVEGIVLRTLDSKFSCKFMNDEYDEKK